jgi:murein L,D-transpeptidase YcbB/YkuD
LNWFLAELPPPYPEYERLVFALARYRKLADEGGWQQIRPRPGAEPIQDRVDSKSLLERLAREDDKIGTDETVGEALQRYQSRNGLEPDGILGPKTLAALNVPASDRVMQIVANMERWRWLPRQLESRRVMVNAADGMLEVVDDGHVVLRSRVIVGTPETRTPIFRAVATGVTFNPPWNVPASIARNEILPRLRRNPNYLQAQNIVLLNGRSGDPHGTRINWQRVTPDAFPYQLQQLPGVNNALGQAKIEMASPFSVYLHDTPGKRDFSRTDRHLSHGCIRVEEIVGLAALALGVDVAAVTDATASGQTKYVSLGRPLPVYVLYWTAMADADGTIQFRPDKYGRDERVLRALRTAS